MFRAFWREPGQRPPNNLRAMGRQRSLGRPEVVLTGTAPDDEARDLPETDRVRPAQIAATSYSAQDALRAKDFAEFTDDELREARRIMAAMRWDLGRRRTWRRRRNEGSEPDLRRVARENIRYGGEPLRVPTRGRTSKPRPLVIIADVSGSMERYARMLLHFIYSVAEGERRVEAFVFATRFTRITGEIARHGVRDAPLVARHVPDWGGGTRIGDAVRTFNVQWARRVVSRGAIVLLDLGRVGSRRSGYARAGDGAAAAQLPAADLAEPAARRARLPAADARHAGGAALRRRFPARAQPDQPRGAGHAPESRVRSLTWRTKATLKALPVSCFRGPALRKLLIVRRRSVDRRHLLIEQMSPHLYTSTRSVRTTANASPRC